MVGKGSDGEPGEKEEGRPALVASPNAGHAGANGAIG